MRLERLDLVPYGQFTEHALRLRPDAALHVVLGENESGKTTTLSALGDLLFGFPKDTDYAFLHHQTLLRVGGAFRLSDGTALEIRRRKGNKDTLLDAADCPISDASLRAALGGIDRETFRSEFGLTAQRLREGGRALLAAGGSLAESLAAGSASLSRLNALRGRLQDEAEGLFGPRRASAKPFYVAFDRHADADRKLRDAVVTTDAISAAETAALTARARETDLKAQHQERGRTIGRWKRAQRVAAKLARLDAIAGELAALADLPAMPAPARTEARAALAAEAAARGEAERLGGEDARDVEAKRGLGVDEALLASGAAIDELGSQLGAVRKDEEDLPRRLGAQSQALGQLDALARRLGLSDPAALLSFAPTDAASALVKTLAAQRRETERKLGEAAKRIADAETRRSQLGEAARAPLDPAPLKRRLDGFADALADAERLRGDRARLDADARALTEAFAALNPAPADLDALARAPLPDDAALVARERDEAAAEDVLRTASRALAEARRGLEGAQAELTRRETAAAGATRADWDAARSRREAALDRLESALEGPAEVRRERFETVRAQAHAADATVESVLVDTSRAARLQAAREALDERRGELTRAEAVERGAAEALAAARSKTAAVWAPSGIAPRDAAEMTRWRKAAAAILTQRAALKTRKAELDAVDDKIAAARESLAVWFIDAGADALGAVAFEEAHRAARERLDALMERKQAALEGEAQRAQAERVIAEWTGERDRAVADAGRRAAEWGPAVAGLKLAPDARLEEAEAALEVWAKIPVPRRDYEEATHRIVSMRGDIAAFERAVGAVTASVAPALTGQPAREVLPKLVAALAVARRAADERDRLDRASVERDARRRGLEAERARLAATLACARAAASARDDASLAEALDRLDQRASSEEERERLRRELVEIGDGLDEAKLRAEQADLDLASVPAQVELAEQEQSRALQEIGEAAAEKSHAEARLAALSQGRDAAGAARDRTEAAAELLDVAERWLVRAAAGKLAQLAVERHRAAAQDPLIARAGAFFAIATAGRYAGLGVGYDANDNPVLEARPPAGRAVAIEGLSEGARDQLFLSLRLALLERRAGEPLPFVGDDLLASFDDARTRRTLELLAEFGAKRQTILFTHHARAAELARGLAGVEIVEM